MSRRWLVFAGACILVVLTGCQVATPPPAVTKKPGVQVTGTPLPPTAPESQWPAERLIFPYLDKIWVAEGAPAFALTYGQSPSLSPDGQRIAYLLPDPAVAGLNQVYVLDLQTNQIQLVTAFPASYGAPVWSPDGQYLAYTNGTILVVASIQGALERVLAQDVGAIGGGVVSLVWSTDGRAIVCPLTREGASDIFAVNSDNGEAVQLSHTGNYPALAPFVVLPQDTQVASKDTVIYANPGDEGTLWAAGLDGGNRRRVLAEMDHVVERMLLSPDGRNLAGLRQTAPEAGYSLWAVDLTDEALYQGGTLPAVPDIFRWGADGRTLYWISEAALFRYTIGSGLGQVIALLPAPTPLPTATPLPVAQRLVYHVGATFYQAEPYATTVYPKEIPAKWAVDRGYTTHAGMVAFARGAGIYTFALDGGYPDLLYSFQQQGLIGIELAWSRQGNILLYAATYSQTEGTAFGMRVDLGAINVSRAAVRRFASITDRSGATPLYYDEESGEAILLPHGQDPSFTHLQAYDAKTGQVGSLYALEGEMAAAVSFDRHWAAAATYDIAARRGALRIYDLTAGEAVSKTFFLPGGTYTWGPLCWSPDGQYVAFIPILGDPYAEGDGVPQGIWVLRAETLEATMVVPLDTPGALLVGWR